MPSSLTDQAVFIVNWRRVRIAMLWIVVAILVIHFYVGITDEYDLIGETVWRRLAYLDSETSVPTWLSTMLMATSAALCWVESRVTDASQRRRWALLGLGFFVLSIDEVTGFHESASAPLRALHLQGALFYGWVLPAIVLVTVAAIYFYPLLPTIPREVRVRILLAGGLFVAGAVGLEMVGGVLVGRGMRGGWPYFLLSTVEEMVEITSVFLFVDTMAMWFAERGTSMSLSVRSPRGPDSDQG